MSKHPFIFLLIMVGCVIGISGFSQNITVANLTEAYRFESNNSQLFSAYALHAREEGLPTIATFFSAIAKVASIHADNFQKVLTGMGTTVLPQKPVIIIKSAGVHVDEALKSVRIEAGIKYAEYIEQAKKDGATKAVKALRWAKETEQASLPLFLKVDQAVSSGTINSLPTSYWVCPTCGNLYDMPNQEEACSYCYTKKGKFINIR